MSFHTCSVISETFPFGYHLQDQISEIVSSIFLQRLLLPGVYHHIALRTTLQEYDKHFTDSEFNSFTVDGLKNELLSLIEHEVVYTLFLFTYVPS